MRSDGRKLNISIFELFTRVVVLQGARSQQISQLVTSSENELSRSQEELLKSLGCQCTSTSVNLTTTDTNILKRSEANQLGQYQFQVGQKLVSCLLIDLSYFSFLIYF